VGVPPPGATAATDAVRVTGPAKVEGLREEERDVVVDDGFTVWLSVILLLPP
jgi:hypothetical protein